MRSVFILFSLTCAHLTAPAQLPTPKQEICRADMDGEIEGYLWDMWPDQFYDECV